MKPPPPAGPGDRVGIAALSGPVDPERLERGLATLRRLGFEPVVAENVLSRTGFLAGGDAERLRAFHRLAADPTLAAILFARGGHGVLRILPGIDWDLLRRTPRAYVGYSDLTPFLHGVVARLGLAAFHGPMVAADLARPDLPPEDEDSLLDALAGRWPRAIPCAPFLRGAEGEGSSGPLLGGCLSLLAATLGTPYAPDLEGAILFWEDLNEAPYRIDRMLTHLRLSGSLAAIKGMIVGHVDPPRNSPPSVAVELAAVTLESAQGFDGPLAWGLPAGHVSPNRTLPLGLRSRLDPDEPRLIVGEG